MLDITQAINQLSAFSIQWSVYVVAVKNEVKEVLFLSGGNETITAIDLATPERSFAFTRDEEKECSSGIEDWRLKIENFKFLYEPNAAILKAGAYKLVAERFGLQKLDVNTHLYAADTLIEHFPGRIWEITNRHELAANSQANVVCRNYPLSPEQLKKKLHLRDGGTTFVIGCRVNGKPTLFVATKAN